VNNKVSIYIPAFNAEKTIEQSIASILNQSIKVDEIIVINDNSSDQTEKIINSFNNIKIINNLKNMGLGYNRNLAIKSCKNNIVGSIDADVVLDKFWLENLMKHLNRNEIMMCGGKLTEKFIDNKYNLWRSNNYSQNWGDKDLLNPPFLYGCNTLQIKNIWTEVKGYDESMLTNGEDIDYTNKVRSNRKNNLYYSAKSLCFHLQDDNLDSLSQRIWRYHSFGYKIKEPSIKRFFKLLIKQLKFLFKRIIKDLFKLNFHFLLIDLMIFFYFIKLEIIRMIKSDN
tara:strand:+ start:530 stop:1378 length:849 start_codon:yes stop_codon:yes gene_type:complete